MAFGVGGEVHHGGESAVGAGLQDGDGGNHAEEDADEQLGDFFNGGPGEVVAGAAAHVGSLPGSHGDHDVHDVAHDVLQFHGNAEDVEGGTAPLTGDEGVGHDAGEEHEVDAAFKAELFLGAGGVGGNGAAFLLEEHGVDDEVEGEQDDGDQQRLHKEMHGGPEEAHALEEAEEQRRIAQRREGAADVGHEEDEEHDLMHAVLAVGVGAQQRTDEEHGGAGGAHPAGEDGAHGQDGGVHDGSAHEGALEADAAGHGEEGEQQQNEGHVLKQDAFGGDEEGVAEAEDERAGNEEGQSPEEGHLAEMMLPEMRNHQGADGYGKQHADKGHNPDDGKIIGQLEMTFGEAYARHKQHRQKEGRNEFETVHPRTPFGKK